MNRPLKTIFNENNCDKGPLKHFYHEVYEQYFGGSNTRSSETPISLLEVGVFNGDSIRSWIDYFTLDHIDKIVGIDLFERTPKREVLKKFSKEEKEKIELIQMDSSDKKIHTKIPAGHQFDYIIDDGFHSPEMNEKTFCNLIPLLKESTGVYFIEDIWPLDIMTKAELNHRWIRSHKDLYTMPLYRSFMNSLDGYFVKRHDMRKKSGKPDSYIFAISSSKKS